MPDGNGFPREARITRKSEYDYVFKHGKKVVGRYFVCHVTRRVGQGRKLGMAVSRKVGPSVVRNRIKRLLREFFRTHQDRLAEDTQWVVVARPACVGLGLEACTGFMLAQCQDAAGLLEAGDAGNAC